MCNYRDENCSRPVKARGLCNKHYQRVRNHREEDLYPIKLFLGSAEERFFHYLKKFSSGCWHLEGLRPTPDGYAHMSTGKSGPPHLAHRWSYEHHVGSIPEGMQIDHLCRNRRCVNPDHLEVVTAQMNTLRGETLAAANAAKTQCDHGHEFTEENTYAYRGHRHCRECRRMGNRKRHSERMAWQREYRRRSRLMAGGGTTAGAQTVSTV